MRWIIMLLLCMSINAVAVEDVFPFKSDAQAKRYHQLTEEIRCLVCQNQSIAESNASIAQDLKREVYAKIVTGVDNQTIKNDLARRYGDFILFKPKFDARTVMLWIAPMGFLLLGIAMVMVSMRQKSRKQGLQNQLRSSEQIEISSEK